MRAWLLAAWLVASTPGLAAGDLGPTVPGLPVESVERFARQNVEEPLLILQEWNGLDLRYRRRDQGLSGTLVSVVEYRILARSALEEASIVSIWDEPSRRIQNVEVRVQHGATVQVYRKKDLSWFESTQRGDGTVTLDGTISRAIVPGIRIGDTVRITRKWKLKGTHGIGTWVVGDADRPTLRSTLEMRLPADYRLGWGEQASEAALALLTHSTGEEKGLQVHRWAVEADAEGLLPRCREEYPAVNITPFIEYAGRDHAGGLAVGADWTDIGRAYLDRIDGVFKPSSDIRNEVARVIAGSTDLPESIDRIYASVQRRCRYLGLFEGMGGVLPVNASEVFDTGFGDCKGLGTLLIAMLRAADIDAHPVLLRTRSAGPLDVSAPNLAQFNHFIVWADDGQDGMFLDATVDRCPAGRVPDQDTLSPVLLLDPKRIGLVEIDPESWSGGELRIEVTGRLDDLGTLEFEVQQSYDGDAARWLRNRLADLGRRDRDKLVQEIALPKEPPLRAAETDVVASDAWREPVFLRVAAQSRGPLPGSAGSLLFPRVLSGGLTDFTPRLRCDRDVDLRRRVGYRESWRVELPPGLVLDQPDSLDLRVDGMRWSRLLWQEGTTLRMERTVGFDAVLVTPEEAEIIRDAVSEARHRESGYFALTRR